MQLDAALITASAAIVIGFGRSASTDMPLTAMFTVAMLSLVRLVLEQSAKLAAGVLLLRGLATLAKGPVAVFLAGLIIVIFAALRRDGRLVLRTLWPIGIASVPGSRSPWFIAVQRANPEFFRVFFLQHNLERFTSNLYHHPQPFWFYLPVALLALVPWTVFVIAAVVDAIRDWRFSVAAAAGAGRFAHLSGDMAAAADRLLLAFAVEVAGIHSARDSGGTILLADFICGVASRGR